MSLSEDYDLEAYIAQIDFEKAFDSIEWPFLFETLKTFGFGANFISWTKLLYNDIYSCVGNNGFFSPFFKLSRSIRQGCPISAMLFLLVAEILAIHIRQNKKISGIQIGDLEIKINLMADDTTLFLSDIKSLTKAISTFQEFEKISGLRLNLNKTEIIPIGKLRNKEINLPEELEKIGIKHGHLKLWEYGILTVKVK